MAALIQHLDSCGKEEEQERSEELTTDQTPNNDNREESDIMIHVGSKYVEILLKLFNNLL